MQETRYNGQIHQRIFEGMAEAEINRKMNAALRNGEEVVRRVSLDEPTVHAINRHERRKAAAIARRSR